MANGNGAQHETLHLAEQFQLVRVSGEEYRLVSLHDSLVVKSPDGSDGLLDKLLPPLETGAQLGALTEGLPKRQVQTARRMVKEFLERGLLEKKNGAKPNGHAKDEAARYEQQRRFFANFQPVIGFEEGEEAAPRSSEQLQASLKDATVLVAGLGRVGSRVAQALASAGVGTIIGADAGKITDGDIADSAFTPRDLGQPRLRALEESVAALNSFVTFRALLGDLFAAEDAALPAKLSMAVLAEDVFDPGHHAAMNRACVAKNVPWIGYRSFGTKIEIGPTVIPNETACYRCYELRRASNTDAFGAELDLRARLAEAGGPAAALNITLGADLVALEVIKTLTHFANAATYGHVYTVDILSMQPRLRPLLKIPRCPECGKEARNPMVNAWKYDAEGEHGAH
jgi:bacteriocin biosynthesis cyclodehydratase domain-containing protein